MDKEFAVRYLEELLNRDFIDHWPKWRLKERSLSKFAIRLLLSDVKKRDENPISLACEHLQGATRVRDESGNKLFAISVETLENIIEEWRNVDECTN